MTKLRNIILRDQMHFARLGLALGSFIWAVQLGFVSELFPDAVTAAYVTSRATFSLMAAMFLWTPFNPEAVWGCLFLIHSISATLSLFCFCDVRCEPHCPKTTLSFLFDGALGCLLWTSSTVACIMAHWPTGDSFSFVEALANFYPPAGMAGSITMALYAWWYMVRSWADLGYLDLSSGHSVAPK